MAVLVKRGLSREAKLKPRGPKSMINRLWKLQRVVVQWSQVTTATTMAIQRGLVVTTISPEVGGSYSSNGVGGDRSVMPPRDPARGKDPAVTEEVPRKAPAEPAEFIPATGTSRHDPIIKSDLVEFVGDDVLTQLLEENPTVVAAVLAAREARQRQIALAEEEERRQQEAEEFSRESEAVERAQEEEAWARESAMELAKSRPQVAHAEFVAETYTPPKPILFVPSGVNSYVARREDYGPKLVLRDPTEHLSVSWAQVYLKKLASASI
ncbi:hypothetical protein RHMOL_Rhmol05G0139200 [Rhododendron molle]|uniref:Uncharacterized protein n=1 Tax=Rhododendron molle TaxID=49168 RepID=A0ACC0NR68_RHOML|nr:hypothetical protein RHMOL_Rhmol05G0139200 [Rhododendron molle]